MRRPTTLKENMEYKTTFSNNLFLFIMDILIKYIKNNYQVFRNNLKLSYLSFYSNKKLKCNCLYAYAIYSVYVLKWVQC